jgi:REP element-mobilizing transposase RayT
MMTGVSLPETGRRPSMRYSGHDYAEPGHYSLTLVTEGRLPLFGDVTEGVMMLSPAGEMIHRRWHEIAQRFGGRVRLGAFVVMPNHTHGVLELVAPAGVSTWSASCDRTRGGAQRPGSISAIMQSFKTGTTNAYIRGVKERGWRPFERRLWQRNYHDHIVRDAAELQRIEAYIAANPARWHEDPENA